MTRKGRRKSATACLAAVCILACYLTQTTDCYRLRKKTERREGRKEGDAAKTLGFQEGKIVFGRVFEKGSSLPSQVGDGTKKASSNASAEDKAAYQADFTGWSKGQAHDASSKEASWKRMAPSLQCGGDQMKFKTVGPGAAHFTVEQGTASPIPLSQVPSTCGYSMHRNSLALVMLVPFDGCNVVQEGGSYMLPMRWHGIPVSLLCPKPATPAPMTTEPHHPVPGKPMLPQIPNIKNPDLQIPQYFFPPYLTYQYPLATTATTTTTKKPEMPNVPQYPYYRPFFPFFPPLPATLTATTNAQPAAAALPPGFPYPFHFPFYPPFPWPIPGPPQTPAPMTTKPAPKPQMAQFPPYFPIFPSYPLPPYPNYPTAKPETTVTTTTKATTAVKKDPILTEAPHQSYVRLPYPFLPFPNYTPSG